MSLNQVRAVALTMLTICMIILIVIASLEVMMLGVMILIGTLWLVTESGTHASHTMKIGQMLSLLFRPPPKPKGAILSEGGLQLSNDKTLGKLITGRISDKSHLKQVNAESEVPFDEGEVHTDVKETPLLRGGEYVDQSEDNDQLKS